MVGVLEGRFEAASSCCCLTAGGVKNASPVKSAGSTNEYSANAVFAVKKVINDIIAILLFNI